MAEPVVTIDQGTLFGKIAKDFQGNIFYKFQGIPYAKPPIGPLRFKEPESPENWSGILDATKERNICYSIDVFNNGEITGSENCLFLNVFTPELPKTNTKLRPVMFWIHGGGYTIGSGNEDLYGADYLITQDVVLVTINYRLGLLGFISFDDPFLDIPGNAGLKDQIMALKWVQKNISKFGGDPNNVTIFGESAGGASVHLLMLSPMGRGLFHKGILQSGCALNPWLNGVKSTKLLAKILKLEENDKVIYDALMEKTVDELFKIQEQMGDDGEVSKKRPLGLVVEKNSKNPFLDKKPVEIMSSGDFYQVPFMIGYTSKEGMIYELHKKPENPEILDFDKIIPWYFKCDPKTPQSEIIAKQIKKFYFNDQGYTNDLLTKKYDIFSDTQFLHGIYTTTLKHFQKSQTPIYLYRVSIETSLNFMKHFLKIQTPGVSHCDDIGYLFKVAKMPEIKPGSKEDIAVRRFIKLWTHFAKFDNPTPETSDLVKTIWKPISGPNLETFDIGNDLSFGTNSELQGMKFWDKIFAESPGFKN